MIGQTSNVITNFQGGSTTPEGGLIGDWTLSGQYWMCLLLQNLPAKRVYSVEVKRIRPEEDDEILLNWRFIQREFFPCNSTTVYGWKQSRREPAFGFPADYYARPLPIGTLIDVGGAADNPYQLATSYGPFWSGHYLTVDNTEVYYGNSTPSGEPLPDIGALSPAQRVSEATTTARGTETPEPIHQYVEVLPGDTIRFTIRQFRCNPALLDAANGLLTDDIPLDGGPADDEEEVAVGSLSFKFWALAIIL